MNPSARSVRRLIRPLVAQLHAYVPGEQPKIRGLIKLNTNENPYPPSPRTLRAVRKATDARLRLYPNPTAQPLRERVSRHHLCQATQVLIGNGSDELLALCLRTFVEPRNGEERPATLQFLAPCYSLYPVLGAAHGARLHEVPLLEDFGLPRVAQLAQRGWDRRAALSFVTTPNAPSGRGYSQRELEELCRFHRGVLVLDEAYVDFAKENAVALALKYPHVLVLRTFSKAYSLCFLRVGYALGHPELIAAMDKVRDSYNVNGLAQIAAQAALEDASYYRKQWRRVIATRQRLAAALASLGFDVFPSQTNFLLVRPPRLGASAWLEQLRERKILVRWFNHPRVRDFLRITVGTDREANALLRAARQILR